MEKRWMYAAGTLAFVGALGMLPVHATADDAAKTGKTDTTTHGSAASHETGKDEPRGRMGDKKTLGDSNVLNDIRGSLRSLVNTAMDEGSLDDVAEFLAKPDRDRMEAVVNEDAPTLDSQIQAFAQAWKTKYQNDFDIDSQSVGAIFDYEIQHDQAQKTANVTIPASGEMGQTKMKLVNEGTITNAWRIDVDDSMSGAQLRDSLQNVFTRLNEQRDKLPAKEEEAKELVAHKILAAVAGSSTGASGQTETRS